MCHHIMPPPALLLGRDGKLFVCNDDVLAHLLNGIVRDVKAKLLLRFGKPGPEPAPGRDARAR